MTEANFDENFNELDSFINLENIDTKNKMVCKIYY